MLDEADEMIDMGFAEDIESILANAPEERQTALFAATMAPRLESIASTHLTDPVRVAIAKEKRAAGKLPRIRQVAYLVPRQQKTAALGRVLDVETPSSAIVFCRTRTEVDELTDTLAAHGYGAKALHGGMEQKARDRVMQMFRTGQADVLVATDVAARGLDIEHVSHVVNYDLPMTPEVYVHRIGRTGRAGREGMAISLVDPRQHRQLRSIEGAVRVEDRDSARSRPRRTCRLVGWTRRLPPSARRLSKAASNRPAPSSIASRRSSTCSTSPRPRFACCTTTRRLAARRRRGRARAGRSARPERPRQDRPSTKRWRAAERRPAYAERPSARGRDDDERPRRAS